MKNWAKIAIAACACVCAITVTSFAVGTLYTLQETGPQNLRLNVVLLAEGYTAAQETAFVQDADNSLGQLLATPPWNQYTSYVNGYAIFVASNESGADHPSHPELPWVDTYFNSTFESYGIDRLLTIPPNDIDPVYSHGAGKVYSLLAEHVPDHDIIIILVNDPEYGGSGGAFAVSSMHVSAPEIVIHEVGHSFAGLADEYDYGGAAPSAGGDDNETSNLPLGGSTNVTTQTNRALIPWNAWILGTTPVPTPETAPYGAVIGLFEGANYEATGWYRPKLNCKMQVLGVPFCAVCAESHVLSGYSLISPIDSISPAPSSLQMTTAEAETLRVTVKLPSVQLRVRWFDNDIPMGLQSGEAVFAGIDLGPGTHELKCVVTDTTHLVRTDPFGLRTDSAMWEVLVTPTCACECNSDPACDGLRSDIIDIITTVNVAFRGVPADADPSIVCPYHPTDTNCDQFTSVIDVVKVVNVAFRGADPAVEFCDPCP